MQALGQPPEQLCNELNIGGNGLPPNLPDLPEQCAIQ